MTTLGKQLVAKGWKVSLCIDECFADYIPEDIEHIKMTLPRREGLPDRADKRFAHAWETLSTVDYGDDPEQYILLIIKAFVTQDWFPEDQFGHVVKQAMDYMARTKPDVCIVDFGLLGGEAFYIKVLCNKLFMPVLRLNSFATPEIWPPPPTLIKKLMAAELFDPFSEIRVKLDKMLGEYGYENGPNDDFPTTIFPTIPSLFYSPEGKLEEPSDKQILCGPLVGTQKDVVKNLAGDDPLNTWIESAATPIVYVAFGTLTNMSQDLVNNLADALVPSDVRANPACAKWRVLWALRAELQCKLPEVVAKCGVLRVEAFVPQIAVLRHEKVKLFVTHHGQNSTTESLLAGKPMVGIPMLGDQLTWAHNIAWSKAGKYVLKSASAEEISKTFNEVFADPCYAQAAKSIGKALEKAAPKACDTIIKTMMKEIVSEERRKKEEKEPKIMPALEGTIEMKVTAKKPASFWIRAIGSFLTEHGKDGEDGKPSEEAKEPIDHLRILGLGNAINVAVNAAVTSEANGFCIIDKIQTAYPPMTKSGRNCAKVIIDVSRKA